MHRHLFEGMNGMSCHFQVGGEDSRFLAPDAKPQYAEDRGFIPTHIDLSLSVDIKKQHVRGEVKTKVELFPHSKEMIFHAVEMTIHSVKVNGKKSPYDYDKEKITIPRGKLAGKGVVAIAFEYTHPPMGMHFIHPTKDRPDKPYQVWTHSEAQEARYWYPCQDLPETKCPITQRITVESPFQVVGNGNLISTKKENGWITYTWDFPHPNPSYLNAIMIGEFDVIREKWKHVDIAYYFRKGKEKEARNGFKNTPQCLAFFSEYTGFEYPHNKYAQVGVADFIYGGMEHTTCTTMTDNILQDDIIHAEFDARPQQLIAHELAHQWFGDLLTCKDWSHGWLNEGFATFFEMLWQEHRNKDEGRYAFYQDIQIYLQEDKDLYRRPIVSKLYQNPSDLFDEHLYAKGGIILHYLRYYLGEKAFREGISHYLHKHAHTTVQTEDLLNAFREKTGKNLTLFFDQWIYAAGFPELRISMHAQGKKAMVRVVQVQKGNDNPLYDFDVDIGVYYGNHQVKVERHRIHRKEHRFTIPVGGKIHNIVWDNAYAVLENAPQRKSREMWRYQALHDLHVLHRIDAAKELAIMGGPEELGVLKEVLHHDPFWGVRAEAALALGNIPNTRAAEILIHAYDTEKNHRVLKNILGGLGTHSLPEAREVLLRGIQREDSYLIPMQAYASLGKHKHPANWAVLMEGLKRESWMDIVRTGCAIGISNFQDGRALKILDGLMHPRYSNELRQNVIRSLEIGGKGYEKTYAMVEKALKDPYINLQLDGLTILGKIGDERHLPILREFQKGHRDSRLKRKAMESIRMIDGGLDLPTFKPEKVPLVRAGKETK